MQPATPKPVKRWVFLMVAPFLLLFFVIGAQFTARFVITRNEAVGCSPNIDDGSKTDGNVDGTYSSDSSEKGTTGSTVEGAPAVGCIPLQKTSTAKIVINIHSLLLGVLALTGMFLTPLWIVLLVKAQNYNAYLRAQSSSPPSGPQPGA